MACAPAPTLPEPIAARDVSADRDLKLPLMLVFEQGESLPLDMTTHGDVVELQIDGGSKLIAKRKLWLLLRADAPPALSLDGERFNQIGGAVSFGFGVTRQRGSFATLDLKVTSKKP